MAQCFDLLDEEAVEDEELREAYAKYDQWTRPSSNVANERIVEDLKRHNRMLAQAKKNDVAARQKWEEWREKIELLSQEPVRVFQSNRLAVLIGTLSRRLLKPSYPKQHILPAKLCHHRHATSLKQMQLSCVICSINWMACVLLECRLSNEHDVPQQ
jgi:ALIX V-shaped domain binding to HIV